MDFEFWNRKHEIAFRAWTWRKKWTMGREKSMVKYGLNGQKWPKVVKKLPIFDRNLTEIDQKWSKMTVNGRSWTEMAKKLIFTLILSH